MNKFLSLVFVLVLFLNAKSQKDLKKAEYEYGRLRLVQAIDLYKKALLDKETQAQEGYINFKIGECFKRQNLPDSAVKYYERSVILKYKNDDLYANYAYILIKNNKKALALDLLTEFISSEEDWTNAAEINRLITSCRYKRPNGSFNNREYNLRNAGSCNSTFSDFGAALFNDRVVFATSKINNALLDKRDPYYGQAFTDMYSATVDTSSRQLSNVEILAPKINTPFNDGAFTYDENTKTAYFMNCPPVENYTVICNVMSSTYNSSTKEWTSPEIVKFFERGSAGHPSINEKGDLMVIIGDSVAGGIGGKDLWLVRKDGSGKWGTPENMGKTVNTKRDELFPYLVGDTMVFFSSDGYAGFGGMDVFYTKYKNGAWTTPVNLGEPLNSYADDLGILFIKNLDKGVITSDRAGLGGVGADDLYYFDSNPNVILSASGVITNYETKFPIRDAKIYVEKDGKLVDSIFTDPNGNFFYPKIVKGYDYKFTAITAGYLKDNRALSTDGITRSVECNAKNGYNLDMALVPEKKQLFFDIEINYAYDKADILPESKIKLDELANILKQNTGFKIEMGSHCDARGSDKYNDKLSTKRAKSAMDYLVQFGGIPKERLTSKGYGKRQPKVPGAQTEEEHLQNRRTTFKFL